MDTNAAERLARVETRQDNTERIIQEIRADAERRAAETDRRIEEMREETNRNIAEMRGDARGLRFWLLGTAAAILVGVPAIVVGLFQFQGSWILRDLDAQNARIERFEEREAARDARIAGVEEGLKQQKRDFDDFRRETAERFAKMDERFDRIESLIMGLHGKDSPRAEAGAPGRRR